MVVRIPGSFLAPQHIITAVMLPSWRKRMTIAVRSQRQTPLPLRSLQPSAVNLLPTIALTAPVNGAVYTAPARITMTAIASDPDGSITQVEFYQGKNKLGVRYASPYTWTIYNAPAYNYSGAAALTARAVDNKGAVTSSNAVAVTVR